MNKHIYLTVDTECHDIAKINQYIYGYKNGDTWGIEKILLLAKEENIPVNFFVDVGECKLYGDDVIQNIVNIIHSYNQPVYFHLHPKFISGDKSKDFLWQYTYQEKEKIINEGVKLYNKFCHIKDKLVFRAGRYGVDEDTYKILSNLPMQVLDVSYIYNGHKMCHISSTEIGVKNADCIYYGMEILPNTRITIFDYFGIQRCVGLDASDATYNEFKRFIDKTNLKNIVYTMHSWNFIKKYFFHSSYIQGDMEMIKKFHKSVKYAKKNGFLFESLSNYSPSDSIDEEINLCNGVLGKILGMINNYIRFQKIARLNKRYFIIYSTIHLILICSIITIIIL